MADIPEGMILNGDCRLLCVVFWCLNAAFFPFFRSVCCCCLGFPYFVHEMSNVSEGGVGVKGSVGSF